MSLFLQFDTWVNLAALSFIEIILGVDNLLLIAIVTGRLPDEQQKSARRLGLLMAMVMRLLLLAAVIWLAGLTKILFSIGQLTFSIRDLVLIGGGIFLLIKSAHEIIRLNEAKQLHQKIKKTTFMAAITEIVLFDILFSLDSVITAVGIVQEYIVMAIAIIIAVLMMLFASEPVSRFIMANTRMKVLALCILFLVGIDLILDGFSIEVSSSYIFVAMGFAIAVELVNRWLVETP